MGCRARVSEVELGFRGFPAWMMRDLGPMIGLHNAKANYVRSGKP